MKQISSFLFLLAIAAVSNFSAAQKSTSTKIAQHQLVSVANGYSQNSVNAAIFRQNSIVTHNKTQFIAFYDDEGYMVLGKRRLNSQKWELQRTQYKGRVWDAHNIISIMVDGDGFLHVAFDHHGHPLNYARSIAPESLTLGDKLPMIGTHENNVTYPEFYRLADGNLIFVYRAGRSGGGDMVMNRYDRKTRQWERVQTVLLDGERQRNAYWQLYVDRLGTIHLSWVWRETANVASNHDLCYARSKDGGISWEKSTGEPYSGVINAANAEYVAFIPQNSELINQTSMTADRHGNPYIASYWRSQDSNVPQYRLVWFDGKTWKQQQVSNRTTPFSLSGVGTKRIPIARPRVVVNHKGKKVEVLYIFRDEERGSKVSMAYSSDLNAGDWKYTDLTDFSVGSWEPSHDSELWKNRKKLHLYVQLVEQGDGETTVQMAPQPVYVLEVKQ